MRHLDPAPTISVCETISAALPHPFGKRIVCRAAYLTNHNCAATPFIRERVFAGNGLAGNLVNFPPDNRALEEQKTEQKQPCHNGRSGRIFRNEFKENPDRKNPVRSPRNTNGAKTIVSAPRAKDSLLQPAIPPNGGFTG